MAVSVNQARNYYIKNRDKFPGMNMTQAVDQMVSSGEIPVAPAEAAPAAAVPFKAPAPAAAAVPAPAPEVAPEAQPAPAVMNPYELALSAYKQANPVEAAAPAVKGAKVDYLAQARQDIANANLAELEANAKIARETEIDSETKELINKRNARYETELSDVDKDRKQATWMAVAQAGMKMAQSESPYFIQALASGMEAGIDGYSEAKAKAAEKKARLQDAKEELVLKAKELRDQAVKDAIGARLAGKQAAAANTQLLQNALSVGVAGATAGDVVEAASLGNQQTRANIANIYSTIGERAAAGRRAEAAARGGGGLNLKNAGQIVNSLVSENKTFAAILENPLASKGEKDNARARMADNTRKIDYIRSLQTQNIGMGSGFKILGPA